MQKICLVCKKEFYISPSRLYKRRHCSVICKAKTQMGKPVFDRTGLRPWNKKTHILKTCLICQKEFSVKPYRNDTAKFCSYKCHGIFIGRSLTPQFWLKGLIKQQNMKESTSIEKAVYDHLLLKGFLFEKQKLINGKFLVDAYIPSLNLVIEADGAYWHSLDRVMKKDKAENAYLQKCGYNLVRLTETEIKDGSFKERMVI